MPQDLPYYTKCAQPGIAHEFSTGGAILTLIASGGIVGYILWKIAGLPCEAAAAVIGGIVAGIIAVIDALLYWYYNERLMCIEETHCAIGTVVGSPHAACDGDRKVDLLIAPYGFLEVEVDMAHGAAATLAGAAPGFPAPPSLAQYTPNRPLRLEYVNGTVPTGQAAQLAPGDRLNEENRKRLYLELVHNVMFAPPAPGTSDRRFQQHLYVRDEAVMGTPAYTNSPDDSPVAADPNPMFRYEKEPESENAIASWFCGEFLGQPGGDKPEDRLVPYFHCEIEGNRLQRGLNNLKLALASFFGAYLGLCAACRLIPVLGQVPFFCELVSLGIAFFIAWLVWLLSKLFNDPDDGEAGSVDFDVPATEDDTPLDDVGDLVLVHGRWIMDVEHEKYFEIHPVVAWYRIARAQGGDPRLIDNPGDVRPGEDVLSAFDIDRRLLQEMCRLAQSTEGRDPDGYLQRGTSGLLAMAHGIA